jgi:photosystem II stability/assembly factor-like uncharacterized protein
MSVALQNASKRPTRLSPALLLVTALLSSLLAFMPVALQASAAAAATTATFGPSGLDGAGFQNVVAVDPRGTGLVLAGGDVSGVHRSTDWGRTWRTSNLGLTDQRARKLSAILFSPSTPGKVYAALGFQGAGGGVGVSTDGGQTWAIRSAVPEFSGGNNNK